MLIAVFLSLLLLFVGYKYLTWNDNYWKNKKIPYVKPYPIVGNFLDVLTFKKTIGQFLSDLYTKMNTPFFGIFVFGTPHLVVTSPELIKCILVRDFASFCDRTVACDTEADSMASNMIFIMRNPEWKTIRSKLTPIFTSGKLKGMFGLMSSAADNLNVHLMKIQGEAVEAKEIIAKFTTDLLTSCAFGINAHSFDRENAEFRQVGRKMFNAEFYNAIRGICYFFFPNIVSLFKVNFFDKSVTEFLRKAFWGAIKDRERKGNKRNDIIDIIIAMKKDGSMVDVPDFEGDKVVAQAMQFFAAGFETTSSTISFALHELCLNPHIQSRLRAEIKSSMAKHGGCTYESLQDMKYLDKVVSEVLRKYPVLPFLDRRCMVDYKLPHTDITIDKGTPIYIPMFGLHYDPKYFPEPEKFDPERFSEENVNKRPAYSYIPFGNGPHNCIGERFGLLVSKLGIVNILSEFEVERCALTANPIVIDTKTFLLQAKGGLHMIFRPATIAGA